MSSENGKKNGCFQNFIKKSRNNIKKVEIMKTNKIT